MHRTRNAAYGQPYRGFESSPLRHLNFIFFSGLERSSRATGFIVVAAARILVMERCWQPRAHDLKTEKPKCAIDRCATELQKA